MTRRIAFLGLAALAACNSPSPKDPADGGPTYAAPYSDTVFDSARITSNSSEPNFQKISADFSFHDGPFISVKLVIDLETTCYPFEKWNTNKPPEGQNWPADCDAFDRNFDFTIDAALKEGDAPGFNVVHAITPFGGPLHLETDLTDLANARPGSHRMRVTIPTWSDGAGQVSGSNGGWNVTARIVATPGPAPRKVLAAIALFDGAQTSTPDLPDVPFTVPEGTTSARLELRTSGHGGGNGDSACIGPAEEFCRRTLTAMIDDNPLEPLPDVWRTDCDSLCTLTHQGPANGGFDYCKENPCGSIQSVKASRANWCPGSETPAFTWDAEALHSPGEHRFVWSFSRVNPGGMWAVSAIYYAFGE